MMQMQEAFERLERFLESYSTSESVTEKLFGPTVHLNGPRWWQRARHKTDAETNRRLRAFNLPEIDTGFRLRFHAQPGQLLEDAGGYVRRKWMVAFGFDHAEYDAWRYGESGESDD